MSKIIIMKITACFLKSINRAQTDKIILSREVSTIFKFKKPHVKKQQAVKEKNHSISSDAQNNGEKDTTRTDIPLTISECEDLVKTVFCNSGDVVVEAFETQKKKAMIVYIDGLVNKDLVDRDIIAPLKSADFKGELSSTIKANFKVVYDIASFVKEVVNGNTAVFYEKSEEIFIVDFKQWEKRSVQEPDSETVTRGPKEGFTENIRTSTALIRRKIRNSNLVFENLTLGRQTNTPIALVYIKDIVNQDVLKELKSRLDKIDTDSILESGYIEQYIDDNTFSPISAVGVTQKPDIAAARILEGRVAILCDGTPHVLTVPELFIENLHSSEDYYNRPLQSTLIRFLRLIGLFIGTLLPGLTVAIITYNQEMIPTAFLMHLINSTQHTPLPTAAEAFFLILMFELLRESGTRLPKTVGSAITIVGSLIIGDAAVKAGIVGAPMVIIIALTAVASFIVPNLTEFILIYRLFFLFLGATMGLIGIGSGVVIMLTQLISTESFGIPILSSFSKDEMKDGILRSPLGSMKYRRGSIAKNNVKRVD